MAIAMTGQQRRDFEEKGYVILDDFLEPLEVGRLLEAVDEVAARLRESTGLGPEEPFAVRNALAQHDAFLDLIDHPKALPLVVDAIGWNIQIRTSHLDYRPPYPGRMQAGGSAAATGRITRPGTATSTGTRISPAATCSRPPPSTGGCRSWRSRSSTPCPISASRTRVTSG